MGAFQSTNTSITNATSTVLLLNNNTIIENMNWCYTVLDDVANISNISECDCNISSHHYHDLCFEMCIDFIADYEMPPLIEIIVPAIVYLIVFLVGTIGNLLVVFVVNRFKRMKNVTNVFLASLSTADLCLILLYIPIMFMKFMSNSWILGRFACYSVHYVQQFTCFCSVLTLTMISIERYVAIANPMRNKLVSSIGRAKRAIILIWILSAILAIPAALKIDYETIVTLRGERAFWCNRKFPNFYPAELNAIYALYQVLLLIVIPVATMSVCYARVARVVYASGGDRALQSATTILALGRAAADTVSYTSYSSIRLSPEAYRSGKMPIGLQPQPSQNKKSSRIAESNKKQIVQMLIAIVVLYLICWMPSIVDEVLSGFGVICRTSNTTDLKYMRMAWNALSTCQSCINPIVYCFVSKNFRATFKVAYTRMKLRMSRSDDSYRSRIGSQSSLLSRNAVHRIGSMPAGRQSSTRPSPNNRTLTVPSSRFITPNMSRNCSELSLDRRLFTDTSANNRKMLSRRESATQQPPNATSTLVRRQSVQMDYLTVNGVGTDHHQLESQIENDPPSASTAV